MRQTGVVLGDRIHYVHMKDVWWEFGNGSASVFEGRMSFDGGRRRRDHRSLGHSDIRL